MWVECRKDVNRYDEYINCRIKCVNVYITYAKLLQPEEIDISKLEIYLKDTLNRAIDLITNSLTSPCEKEIMKLAIDKQNLEQEIKQLTLLNIFTWETDIRTEEAFYYKGKVK